MLNALGKKSLFGFLTCWMLLLLMACGETTTATTTTTVSSTGTTATTASTTTSGTLTTSDRLVTSISLDNPDPFYSGEFSFASVTVVVHYDDETTEDIPLSPSMLSVEVDQLGPGTHQVTVSYGGCETIMTLEILEPEPELFSLYFHLDDGILGEGVEESFWNLAEGTQVTLPTPSKLGFEFLGWFTDPDFEYGPWFETYDIDSDQHFYARWEETTVLINIVLDEFLLGDNHTLTAMIYYSENNDLSRLDVVLSYLATQGEERTRYSVTNRLDYVEGGPLVYPEYHVVSTLEIDGFRYVYEKQYEENYGTLTRVDLQPQGVQGNVDTSDSPFDFLDPSAFVRRSGEWTYDYVPVGEELVQFAHAVYDGDFVEDEVIAVLSFDPMGFTLGIPLLPWEEGTGGWPAIITIDYVLSDIDITSAAFPLEEAAASVMNELTTVFNDRVEALYPTPASLAEYQQLLDDAQTTLMTLEGVEQLYAFYQTQIVEFINFVLITDPLKLMKDATVAVIAGQWAALSEVATEASLALMSVEYETMMASIEGAETEEEVTQISDVGWTAVLLVFVEDPAKAGFVAQRTQAYSDLLQFDILLGYTISGADPGYNEVYGALEAAKATILGMTYPSNPATEYAILVSHLFDLYHACTEFGLEEYKNQASWIVNQCFFNHASIQQEYLWEAMLLFAEERNDALSAILAASTPDAVWNALIAYLHQCQAIADEAWRQDFLDGYFDTFNDFYYRLDSAYSGAFAEEYVVLRDRMDAAVLSASFKIIDLQFQEMLQNAVLDDVKNARQDAIGTIQSLLLIKNPIATQASQTDMYNAMVDGYDALYAATTLGAVETALQECLTAINAGFVEDAEKAALFSARAAALAKLTDYLLFSAQFATNYAVFDEILLIGFDYIQWIPGQYTVTEVHEHLAAFDAEIGALGYTHDAALLEAYRAWALTEIDGWLELLAVVPPDIADAYDFAQAAIISAADPFSIRDAWEEFVAQVQPLL